MVHHVLSLLPAMVFVLPCMFVYPSEVHCRLTAVVVALPCLCLATVGMMACVTVMIGYASSLQGMEKLELLSLLLLKVVPSCGGVPLHFTRVWRSPLVLLLLDCS